MLKLINGSHASARSAGKPVSTFPGAVAGDAQLAIAVNREQTRLAVPLSNTATSMTVQSIGSIAIWSLLSIDDEIVQVNNPPVGNVVPIARGFDGTTAAIHLAGATVAGLIDAYHHNTLVAEVEAIEAALGPNLVNVGGSQAIINTAFQFAAQTPGGALTVGANVITLAPVPKGVNGTDINHYLYISGGTGTAEAGQIIGGTAVSGASSGTVIVQCANTHSGAWTIQTATAGIQEAYQTVVTAGTGGGTVYIASGTNIIYAGVGIQAQNITISGLAAGASIIKAANNANINNTRNSCPVFVRNSATGFNLLNCVIDGNRDNNGVDPAQTVAACVIIQAGNCQVVNCEIRFSPFNGIFIGDASLVAENIVIDRCYVHDNGRVDGHGGTRSGFGGVGVQAQSTPGSKNIRITNSKFVHNHNAVVEPGDGSGVYLVNSFSVIIANNYFQDNFNVGGGQLAGAVLNAGGTAAVDAGWTVTSNVIAQTTTFGTPPDSTHGIEICCRDFSLVGNVIYGASQFGINIDGPGTGNGSVIGNTIYNTGHGMTCLPLPGHSADHIVFAGNSVNASVYAFQINSQHTYIAVKNNILIGGTQAVAGPSGIGCEYVDNLVSTKGTPHNVTMTASPMDYTAGPTQEMIAIKTYTSLVISYLGTGLQIANSTVANSTWTWLLNPGDVIHIQYAGSPVMTVVPLD